MKNDINNSKIKVTIFNRKADIKSSFFSFFSFVKFVPLKIRVICVKKAFTLVELLIVLAIIGLLTSIGFGGLIIFRNSIIANNTAQSIKTAIRDAQDKALTFSTYNSVDIIDPLLKDKWTYGYSLQYNNLKQSLELYSLVSDSTGIPLNGTNTDYIRATWKKGLECNSFPGTQLFLPDKTSLTCHFEKAYSLETPVESYDCDAFFTSVNGKITILKETTTSPFKCNIVVTQNTKTLTITMSNQGLGDINVCEGEVKEC
jgi:prepilin-type N-terminal cleavage/methylation domain-containing protein